MGVTSPIVAPRIGAARDAEKRMLKWSEGMEPRFIGWNVAAAHTFDFSFPDAWSRKKIKALPSRRPEVSAEMWNEVYSPTDDLSRLKWSGEVKVVMMEVAKESRGGSYITIEDLAPHGEEYVEFLVNDELFYHEGDMTVPARPDSGIDSRQRPSEPRPKPDAGDDDLMDARTQQVLIDQLFSVPKCVRLARMSERSHDLLAKIFRAVPKRSEGELQDVVGEEFLRLNEGNVSEFQKQKASGALPTEFLTIEEKDDLHRILMEVEPLLGASGYRTRTNIVGTHGEYPCHCLAQTLWYPKRGNLMLVWDVEELYSTGLPDQNQQVSIVVVSAMLAVRWLEANADTSEQETAVPTPEQLSNVKMSRELDLFRTTCKVLRIPKAIERIWSRQRLMPWFRAVMTSWMYERAKRHMSRNTEAYQSFQLDIGPGAYKRAFLTHRNAVTTAVKRVAGAPCVTEDEKKEVLRADLERNVSLCLQNSFCRNREQKVNVDLLPCCKPRLLEQESWGTARSSMDMLEKVLEDSEDQDGEVME